MTTIEPSIDRFLQVREQVARIEAELGRLPGSVKILAVSKGRTTRKIEALYQAGCLNFAENYVQEALPKINTLASIPLIKWHFIGRIQRNKTQIIAQHFAVVHSVTSLEIARRLNMHRQMTQVPLQCLIQIKLDPSSAKAGVNVEEVHKLAAEFVNFPRLKLVGLMTILDEGLETAAIHQSFARLRQLKEDVNTQFDLNLSELSMGMSNDYAIALTEGATWLRLGRIIFAE